MPRFLSPRLIFCAVLVVLTAIWCFSGRGFVGVANQWMISPNQRAWPLGAWLLPLGVLLIFGGAAALSVYDRFKRAKTRKEQTNSTVTALICLTIVLFLWPWALLGPGQIQTRADKLTLEGRFNIIAAQWSDVATQYFGAAYQINDAREFSRFYAQKQQNPASRALAHVATHPPGAVLFFYASRRFCEKTGLDTKLTTFAATLTSQTPSEMLVLANVTRETANRAVGELPPTPLPVSALGTALFCAFLMGFSLVAAIPALYGLAFLGGNENGDGEKRGLLAVALWVLAPTTNLFAFTLDAVVASGAIWTLFFAARGWETRRPLWLVLSGISLALTSFLSLGALTVGAILIFAWLIWNRKNRLRDAVFAGAAFGVCWLVFAIWGGFNPLEIVAKARAAHHFATLEVRSFWPWVVVNLGIWALFCGWPVALHWWPAKQGKARELIMLRGQSQGGAGFLLALATLGVLVALSLSGNVRGEVERLWLFALAPLCVLATWNFSRNPRLLAGFLAFQAAQTLVMAATLAPLVRPF